MNRGFSLWLDAIRALAALAVLFGHMAHIRFTRGDYIWLREVNIASDAVVVFFVISGLVIAYAAGRDASLSTYAFNRLTRIFTVIVPALILTLTLDAIGTRIDMAAYPYGYYQALPVEEFLLRGLTLTPQWSVLWDPVRLGTNGPLWSLSYEVAYYILFGAALFLRGALRVVMVVLVALLAGLNILLLLPAWALGVLVWQRMSRGPALPQPLALGLALGAPALIIAAKVMGLPAALSSITAQVMAPTSIHALGYSDEVLWNSLLATLVALHLIGAAPLLASLRADPGGQTARVIRWIAGGSFSLYVMHYPVLHLLDATLPETLPLYDLWLLGLTLAACFGFAALFERPLKLYRGLLIRRKTPPVPAE